MPEARSAHQRLNGDEEHRDQPTNALGEILVLEHLTVELPLPTRDGRVLEQSPDLRRNARGSLGRQIPVHLHRSSVGLVQRQRVDPTARPIAGRLVREEENPNVAVQRLTTLDGGTDQVVWDGEPGVNVAEGVSSLPT